MIDLAIIVDSDSNDVAIVETNSGAELKAPDWGTDTDPKLVAFYPSKKRCEIVDCAELANDIGYALDALRAAGTLKDGKPEWFNKLELYAAGAPSTMGAR